MQCVKKEGPPTSTTMRSEAICKTLRHTDQHNRVASASNSNLIGLTSTDIASNIGCGNKQNSSTGDQEQKGQNDALPASRIKRRHPTQQRRRRQDTQNQDKSQTIRCPSRQGNPTWHKGAEVAPSSPSYTNVEKVPAHQ